MKNGAILLVKHNIRKTNTYHDKTNTFLLKKVLEALQNKMLTSKRIFIKLY